jgi:RimJ/RimL family protein N-acetyltransferase
MQIRPLAPDDLPSVCEIDGTVESTQYLHVDNSLSEGSTASWRLEQRPARQKLIDPNRLSDEALFTLKQILSGADEGVALAVEHDDQPIATLVARPNASQETLEIVDLRVDYDFRRQGMGTALLYQLIGVAREQEIRAISAQTLTNNHPAAALLGKCGFELSGVDTRRRSNHDLVKEAVTLFWYVPLD